MLLRCCQGWAQDERDAPAPTRPAGPQAIASSLRRPDGVGGDSRSWCTSTELRWRAGQLHAREQRWSEVEHRKRMREHLWIYSSEAEGQEGGQCEPTNSALGEAEAHHEGDGCSRTSCG